MEINNQHNFAFNGLNSKLAQGIINKRVKSVNSYQIIEHEMFPYLKNSSINTVLRPVKDSNRRLEAIVTDQNNKEHVMKEGKLSSLLLSPAEFINGVVQFVKKLEK